MASSAGYFESVDSKQEELDRLISRYGVGYPPVGSYIDIIVGRERCMDFVGDLTDMGFAIEAVSWWCHATEENKRSLGCPHGYGGPMTEVGWFSEITHEFDEVDSNDIVEIDLRYDQDAVQRMNASMAETIRNKQVLTAGPVLSFSGAGCLTPGFWIRVPEVWKR